MTTEELKRIHTDVLLMQARERAYYLDLETARKLIEEVLFTRKKLAAASGLPHKAKKTP